MNEMLRKVYLDLPKEFFNYTNEYNKDFDKEQLISYPYLLSVSNEYFQAKIKIMLVGQKTYSWFGEKNNGIFSCEYNDRMNLIIELQNLYDLFVNDINRDYNSPFWQHCNAIHKKAKKNGIGIVYNNIEKIGYNTGYGYDSISNAYFDSIFIEEIKICKPDIIIFLTGPNYDKLIAQRLGSFELCNCIDGINIRRLASLQFVNRYESMIYRTYNPKFLQMRKNSFSWINDIYDFIYGIILTNNK